MTRNGTPFSSHSCKPAEADQCHRRYQELHRRAQALDLLLNLLTDKRILFDAASRHQILLFTCHPEKWQDLGVPPVDIQASR